MADEANAQAVEQAAPVENTTAESATENQTEEQTSQTEGQDAKSQGQEQSDQDSSTASTGEKSKSETQDTKESKPLSRRSAAYRIQQLVEENKTLKQQIAKPKDPDEWNEEPRADEPNIAELVAKEVEKRLNPVVTASSQAADDAELTELFSGNNAADRTKYEGQIRSLWNLPQYKDVAAVDLLNMLRGKEMHQVLSKAREQAVEEYKKAQKEAKESSASGTSNTNRSGKTGKSVADMSPKELEEHNQRVIAGLV